MAKLEINEEWARKFVDEVFVKAAGKDFGYVLQAVKEKMDREAIKEGESE